MEEFRLSLPKYYAFSEGDVVGSDSVFSFLFFLLSRDCRVLWHTTGRAVI
jgi:hypothetical protein